VNVANAYLQNFMHEELGVKLQAGVMIKYIIDKNEVKTMLQQHVPNLIEAMLKLISEQEHEELVSTLETIVTTFINEVKPYAHTLCEKLSCAFCKIADGIDFDDENSDNQIKLGQECLNTIYRVIESVKVSDVTVYQLEQLCYPIFDKILKSDNEDRLEWLTKVIDIMNVCII
jgi:hypothetical protein